MGEPTCHTKDCPYRPLYRFTWPGKDEAVACETCTRRLLGVAEAIGLHLQVLPLVQIIIVKPEVEDA